MHLQSIMLIASAAAAVAMEPGLIRPAHRMSAMAIRDLEGRQLDICKPIKAPYTCERSCGEGFEECGGFPNCYNPTEGQSCCTDGTYCPEGYFCTDAGCCPNGSSLSECDATESLTAPPTASPTPTPTNGGDDPSASPTDSFPSVTVPTFGSDPTSTPLVAPTGAAARVGAQGGLIAAGVGLLAVL
ncbi:hypothetical protein FQN50_001416 [Emmonsiellopsis sp. PD_5]|nr:hypothetical protein FQN50_001416 [Emmonsiellopsis sp. PD_5]